MQVDLITKLITAYCPQYFFNAMANQKRYSFQNSLIAGVLHAPESSHD